MKQEIKSSLEIREEDEVLGFQKRKCVKKLFESGRMSELVINGMLICGQ